MAEKKEMAAEDHPERLECLNILPEVLIKWFIGVRRELPWREDASPYHVWISEIMLQQTRIEAVRSYYSRFLQAFPDIPSLAAAKEEEVLKLWEGLGYYSRARNLMKAAIVCEERYGGELPADYHELKKLPGIGAYTAGAIGSISFHLPVPAVDGNVMRVMTRFLADDSDISKAASRKRMEARLQRIMPEDQPGEFNQAIMELGETICIPNGRPLCSHCPLADWCMARKAGEEEKYPVKPAKKERRIEEKTILLMEWNGRYAVRRRPGNGLLAGMYEFPWKQGVWDEDRLMEWLKSEGQSGILTPLPRSKHIFSHVEWHMTGWHIKLTEPWADNSAFETPARIKEKYPIPTALKTYAEFLYSMEKS
ncbi:MAG: A/G-specific adenine glycosylase [Clostridiales bacterium]|nr:A/G-specific adenine glycosylase [Clostridiales bacterium]